MTEESPPYEIDVANSKDLPAPTKKKHYCVVATDDGICILIEAPATMNSIKAIAQQFGIANKNLRILIPLNPGG